MRKRADDIGGPYLSGTQAQGISVVALDLFDNCSFSWFSPIVRILLAFRLRLLTDGCATTPPSVVDVLCERTGGRHIPVLGLSLLTLDTQTGSIAEGLYERRGWQRIGTIDDYAATPDGRLAPTTIMAKHL